MNYGGLVIVAAQLFCTQRARVRFSHPPEISPRTSRSTNPPKVGSRGQHPPDLDLLYLNKMFSNCGEKRKYGFVSRWAKRLYGIKLLGGCCNICGCNDIFVLEFHHPGEKNSLINKLVTYRWSRLYAELPRCELICANCHMELHTTINSRASKRKKYLLNLFGADKCQQCYYKPNNLGSLVFHHRNMEEKSFEIGEFVARYAGITIDNLKSELPKCDLLCKNCHTKIHTDIKRFYSLLPLIERIMLIRREFQKSLEPNEIIQRYRAGMTKAAIAREMKCAKSTVRGILERIHE